MYISAWKGGIVVLTLWIQLKGFLEVIIGLLEAPKVISCLASVQIELRYLRVEQMILKNNGIE